MNTIKTIATLALFASSPASLAVPVGCNVDLKPGVIHVTVKPSEVVDVCLPKGEKIADMANGHPHGWLVTANKETGRIMVQLNGLFGAVPGTNLIVWSDKANRYEVKLAQSAAANVNPASKELR